MTLTFEKFQIAPMKVRVLFVKKLLNCQGYALDENFLEDKHYKRALKKWQEDNNFGGNCMISHDVFYKLISFVSNYDNIWNDMR